MIRVDIETRYSLDMLKCTLKRHPSSKLRKYKVPLPLRFPTAHLHVLNRLLRQQRLGLALDARL